MSDVTASEIGEDAAASDATRSKVGKAATLSDAERIEAATERALSGNLAKGAAKLKAQNKLFVRERLALLLDAGSFVEDSLLANTLGDDLPADGVVTGRGRVDGSRRGWRTLPVAVDVRAGG